MPARSWTIAAGPISGRGLDRYFLDGGTWMRCELGSVSQHDRAEADFTAANGFGAPGLFATESDEVRPVDMEWATLGRSLCAFDHHVQLV